MLKNVLFNRRETMRTIGAFTIVVVMMAAVISLSSPFSLGLADK